MTFFIQSIVFFNAFLNFRVGFLCTKQLQRQVSCRRSSSLGSSEANKDWRRPTSPETEDIFDTSNKNPSLLSLPPLTSNNKKDVTYLIFPGVYEIFDKETGFSYYGESQVLIHRLNKHQEALVKGNHECTRLREAFATNNDLNRIQFFVLDCGPAWADSTKRIARQDAYIEANKYRCFNKVSNSPSPHLITPVLVMGKRYKSIREASRVLGVAKATLLRRLRDQSNTDYQILHDETTKYGEIPLFGKKGDSPSLLFNSLKECIDAGFATNNQNIRRKIKRKEPGWKYAQLNEEGKPSPKASALLIF